MRARHLAFACLVAGEAIFLGLILIGGAAYPGYDHARQYISELGATGAVTGPAVSWWGFMPSGALILAFCLIAAWLMRRRSLAVVGLLLLAWYAFGLINSAAFPCDFECAREDPSPAQMMHDLVGGTGYLVAVAGVLLVALSAVRSRARWLVPLGVVCAMAAFAGFAGIAADIEFRGVSQRLLEAALALFLIAFGYALMKGAIGIEAKRA